VYVTTMQFFSSLIKSYVQVIFFLHFFYAFSVFTLFLIYLLHFCSDMSYKVASCIIYYFLTLTFCVSIASLYYTWGDSLVIKVYLYNLNLTSTKFVRNGCKMVISVTRINKKSLPFIYWCKLTFGFNFL
jgi:hypothetical protein